MIMVLVVGKTDRRGLDVMHATHRHASTLHCTQRPDTHQANAIPRRPQSVKKYVLLVMCTRVQVFVSSSAWLPIAFSKVTVVP